MKARIETKHLILRNFRISDAESMFSSYCHDEKVTQYLTWYPHQNIDETKFFLKNVSLASIDESNGLELAITKRNVEDHVIGSISVVNQFENLTAEIGYALSPKEWNQGYMSEAFLALIDFLFINTPITKIIAKHHENNLASGQVMKHCHLQRVADQMSQMKFDRDELVNCHCYELSRETWQKIKK